jgi:hypothetical protein
MRYSTLRPCLVGNASTSGDEFKNNETLGRDLPIDLAISVAVCGPLRLKYANINRSMGRMGLGVMIGSESSMMSGVMFLPVLQAEQHATRLSSLSLPPLNAGCLWSMCKITSGAFCPQYWQVKLSRLRMRHLRAYQFVILFIITHGIINMSYCQIYCVYPYVTIKSHMGSYTVIHNTIMRLN